MGGPGAAECNEHRAADNANPEAVAEITNKFQKPVIIYSDRRQWALITGGCGTGATNNCSDLIDLPLWDVEAAAKVPSDNPQHCGDGISGLTPFTPYSRLSWQQRLGNQLDFGPLSKGCNGQNYFGISENLDFFESSLFQ